MNQLPFKCPLCGFRMVQCEIEFNRWIELVLHLANQHDWDRNDFDTCCGVELSNWTEHYRISKAASIFMTRQGQGVLLDSIMLVEINKSL